ncbi:MAG: VanZ family protein [Gracilibacteraceae bacterium]|jgi:D-alanyl-D-alanine carboxypeptidase (penicillin-binding protein 5/6)|nr:VanZ family protein [Gracilibacteraceae bacterium]
MKKTSPKTAAYILLALFALYLIVLVKITIFQGERARALNLVPLATIAEYSLSIWRGNVIIGISNLMGNLIIFFPFGYICASLFPAMRKLARIMAAAFVFSLAIEICQYIFACGSADIDDVILNSLGGLAGFGIYALGPKKSAHKKAILISALMIVLVCTGLYARSDYGFILNHSAPAEMPGQNTDPPGRSEAAENSVFSGAGIASTQAFLIRLDQDGSEIILDKGGNERIYPASMTKIMTAVVALEHIKNLDVKISLDEKLFATIRAADSSVAGFLPGEKVRALDLLYGLMLPSGAECAMGLAEYTAWSESAFVDLMNEKAGRLGMNDTHFTNAVGLHDQNHYSTAKDIAALVEYAIKNDVFYRIFTAEKYSAGPTNLHADGIIFYSTLFSKMKRATFAGGVILGGKTGYTGEAGQCLASLAEKNGERFILVTCGAPGDNQTQILHIEDARKIFGAIR